MLNCLCQPAQAQSWHSGPCCSPGQGTIGVQSPPCTPVTQQTVPKGSHDKSRGSEAGEQPSLLGNCSLEPGPQKQRHCSWAPAEMRHKADVSGGATSTANLPTAQRHQTCPRQHQTCPQHAQRSNTGSSWNHSRQQKAPCETPRTRQHH